MSWATFFEYLLVFLAVRFLFMRVFSRRRRVIWTEQLSRYLLRKEKVKWAFWVRGWTQR